MKIYDSVLKPCPFCGNKKSVHAYTYKDAVYRQYAVKCNKCGARIMGASTELAIDKWNCRAERTAKVGNQIFNNSNPYTVGAWMGTCECGELVSYSSKYCHMCGAKLDWSGNE